MISVREVDAYGVSLIGSSNIVGMSIESRCYGILSLTYILLGTCFTCYTINEIVALTGDILHCVLSSAITCAVELSRFI